MISALLVKELREKSGAGMMDAKKALLETDGDIEAAQDLKLERYFVKNQVIHFDQTMLTMKLEIIEMCSRKLQV